jgi:uncharacterized protein (DUF305 family)
MTHVNLVLAAALAVSALTLPAFAQEGDLQLPEQCSTSASSGAMDHSSMGHGAMQGNQQGGMASGMMDMMDMMGMSDMNLDDMPEHVQENMRKMMITMPAMHEGMMIEDPDIAFACGMIAHHHGAIDMAQVLLDYGSNPQLRMLAEEIIAAQVDEIEFLTEWLAENAN